MEHTELCTSISAVLEQLGDSDAPELQPIRTHLTHAERWAHAGCIQQEQRVRREQPGRHRRLQPVGPERAVVKSELAPAPAGGLIRRIWHWAVPTRSGGTRRGIALTWDEAMSEVDSRLSIKNGETYADRWARRSGHPVGSGPVALNHPGEAKGAPYSVVSPPSRGRHAGGPPLVPAEGPEVEAYRSAARALAESAQGSRRPMDGCSVGHLPALASLDQERFWNDLGRAA